MALFQSHTVVTIAAKPLDGGSEHGFRQEHGAATRSMSQIWHRFGLTASPFDTAPSLNPWIDGPFKAVFYKLKAAIDERRRLIVVTGPAGSGRTTMVLAAVAASSRRQDAVWLTTDEGRDLASLERWLLTRLGGNGALSAAAEHRLKDPFSTPTRVKTAPLLLIDDFEDLPSPVVDKALGLLIAAASKTSSLSALLITEPLTAVRVGAAAAEHIPRDDFVEVTMPPLGPEETEAFIAHRLASVGFSGASPFTADAILRIANIARGQPLRINRLCESCFDGATPASLPIGKDVVIAALANSLSAAESGTAPQQPAATGGAGPRGADEATLVAGEQMRLERLARRVNSALDRSFQRRRTDATKSTDGAGSPPLADVAQTSTKKETSGAVATRVRPAAAASFPRARAVKATVLVALGIVTLSALALYESGRWPALLPEGVAIVAAPKAILTESVPPSPAQMPASDPTTVAPTAATAPPEAGAESATTALSAPPSRVQAIEDAAGVDVDVLLARGDALLRQSDIVAAQMFFHLAAEHGSAAGAMAMAATYDPLALREAGIRGGRANPGEALSWYRRAADLGAPMAEAHRERLLEYLRKAAAGGDGTARNALEKGQR
jgi:type II secretory pathway predicted ATPase ExeA